MEQRFADRYGLKVSARLSLNIDRGDSDIIDTVIKNISSRGVFLTADRGFPEGSHVRFEMLLPVSGLLKVIGEDRKIMVKVNGRIIRSSANGMAIEFDKDYEIVTLEEHTEK